MARVPIREVVLDPAGNVKANIPITVHTVPDNTLATIYSAETGGATLPNPVNTDGSGRIPGWLDEGAYELTVGSDPVTVRINLADAERTTGASPVLAAQVFD
jgi:hypothetical protein